MTHSGHFTATTTVSSSPAPDVARVRCPLMLTRNRFARSLCSTTLALALLAPTRSAGAAPAPETPAVAEAPAPAEPVVAREVPVLRVEASEDEVILLDGSFVRGKIVELAKGSHVTISLGEPRTIPWAEVQEVRIATAAAQPVPTPAEPVPTPAEPAAVERPSSSFYETSGPGRPRVHIESRNGERLTLYQIDGGFVGSGSAGTISGIAYRPVCSGTCDRRIDGSVGHKFFVGGDGISASRRFTLAEETGRVTLDVKAGRRAAYVGGYVLTILGGSSLLLGAVFIPTSKRTNTITDEVERNEGMRNAGVGLAVAGSLALVSGIVLMVVGRTVVKKRRGG
jgi:hypothetical protein